MSKTQSTMKIWLFSLICLFVLCPASQTVAGDFQKGLAAYNKGDYVTALLEFQPLAEDGDPSSQYNIALMYAKGRGVPKDYKQALDWYSKAAEQGHVHAQHNLGFLYASGQGVSQDYIRAYAWWSLAALQGDEEAKQNLGTASERMSSEQITKAKELSKQLNNIKSGNQPIEEAPAARPIQSGMDKESMIEDMNFVWIKGGCFQMGQTDVDKQVLELYEKHYEREQPRHLVCVDGFYMGKHEVTVGQFRKFINDTEHITDAERSGGCNVISDGKVGKLRMHPGKSWRDPNFDQTDNAPVVCVSWNDTGEYIQWLGKQNNREIRLPTEAEWEYAARAGTTTISYWGDQQVDACGYANVADEAKRKWSPWATRHGCNDEYTFTAPVGSFRPNRFGLYDMIGNVEEWTADWYDHKYYSSSPRNNSKGPSSGVGRVFRGGSWYDFPWFTRSAYRYGRRPDYHDFRLGFRLVMLADQ
jgi:formylglycine-generating enzyme required for sulfatase activity